MEEFAHQKSAESIPGGLLKIQIFSKDQKQIEKKELHRQTSNPASS